METADPWVYASITDAVDAGLLADDPPLGYSGDTVELTEAEVNDGLLAFVLGQEVCP
jgi:hypothetical protein